MTSPEAQPPIPAPKAKRRRWPVAVATLLIVPLLLFAIYTFFVVSWSYSDGERAGTLQKFSRKGWLCKTYEGELALYVVGGVAPPGMRTEAYTWPITSFVGGIAGGAALAGFLVEGPGWRTAFVVAAGFAALGGVLAVAWRRTMIPAAV